MNLVDRKEKFIPPHDGCSAGHRKQLDEIIKILLESGTCVINHIDRDFNDVLYYAVIVRLWEIWGHLKFSLTQTMCAASFDEEGKDILSGEIILKLEIYDKTRAEFYSRIESEFDEFFEDKKRKSPEETIFLYRKMLDEWCQERNSDIFGH